MDVSQAALGLSLKALNRFAGLELVDRLGLREPAVRALRGASKQGFRTAGAAGRTFAAAQRLGRPARPATGPRTDQFDLTPTDEQQMMSEAVGEFGQERLLPAARAADEACSAPVELLEQTTELGVVSMSIPEELGGVVSERSAVTSVLIAEALARGDMGLALACLAPTGVSTALTLWGDEDQQARYLPEFAGESPPAAALALLEPRALFDPFRLETRARPAGSGYVLEGVKSLVPRAADAELLVIGAELEGSGPALFVVESKTAGISIEPEPAMGVRAAATGRVHLEGVELGGDALLGGADAEVYTDCVALARLGWCALAVGTARAVLDLVIPYVNEREAFGEPISHRQAVAFNVADIGIELEGMRLTTLRAASRADQGRSFAREAAIARQLCARKGMKIGSDGVGLLGGHGYVKEYPVERWYRDLRAASLMEGALLV
ncbi:MAG TPA: acyl-CoA dehydrogenase family protein [Thermoleophilaceae bacterium]|nr:acyl-CoA dehydrogenase family protein [Thermoleophilaceae bacterium]